jgi:endonuclease-3
MTDAKLKERKKRVKRMLQTLEKLFPEADMMLNYSTPFECLVAVILSAQCTDERVNKVTKDLFKKYRSIDDFATADQRELEQDVRSTGYYRNKAKNIIGAARMVRDEFGGVLPKTIEEMIRIPGAARKTANVVLGNVYGIYEGIAVDTHVRRTALRFDLTDFDDPVRIERDLMQVIPKKDWFRSTYLFIEYARQVCPARKHECSEHPLTKIYPKAATVWPKAK